MSVLRSRAAFAPFLDQPRKLELNRETDIPFPQLLRDPELAFGLPSPSFQNENESEGEDIIFVCRRGNDSLLAARAVREHRKAKANSDPDSGRGTDEKGREGEGMKVLDLRGGLRGWSVVEPDFPVY
ncbi:hypothetical protein BT69DRAFT_1337899 [Atractiella rhizophila]|nr:hypothetical protein BT69DRAFT_1337899 [Atractiella rhizophila]